MVGSMRIALVTLVVAAGTAHAAPIAQLETDLDGDGKPDPLELDASGAIRIGPTTVSLGTPVTHATLAAAQVEGTPTIVVTATTAAGDEAFVLVRETGA